MKHFFMTLTFVLALLTTSISFAGVNKNASATESQMMAFQGVQSKAVSMQEAEKLSGEAIPLWAVAIVGRIILRQYVAPYLVKKALPWIAKELPKAVGGAVVANYINCGKWRCP